MRSFRKPVQREGPTLNSPERLSSAGIGQRYNQLGRQRHRSTRSLIDSDFERILDQYRIV